MTIGDIVTGIICSGVLLIIPILILFAKGPTIVEWFVDCMDEWGDLFDWLKDRRNK